MTVRFEDVIAWHKARVFINHVYQATKEFPSEEKYGLASQFQRAAVSIMNNIAEGFEAGSDATFIRYLNISKGSCSEVKSMLYLCSDLNYCSEEIRIKLQTDITAIISGIYNLIKYLEADKK